jgi:hypothetical protein
MQVKQNTSFRVPVRLRSAIDGTPLTFKTYGQVTVYLQKQAGSSTVKTLGATDWYEVDYTNFPGVYDLVLSTTDTNTVGFLKYSVTTTNGQVYVGVVEIVAGLASDITALIGTPAGASLAADIASIQTDTTRLRRYQEGRWKIWTTSGGSGELANQLVLYDTDNTTILAKFNLFDSSGTATTTNPFERVKV